MSIWARLFLGLTLAFATAPSAQAQDSVTGTMQLDNETVTLTHVYARQSVPSPSDTRPGHVIILMTDRPAPPEIRASRQAYYAAAREGRIRGALLVLEPDPRFVLFAPNGSYTDTAVPDVFDRIALSNLQRSATTVSGQLRTSEPGNLDFGEPGSPATYRIDARFSAAITPAPQPQQTLSGDAARNTPQAAAAAESLRVIHNGTVADILAVLHSGYEMRAMLEGERSQEILQLARQMLPQPDRFLQTIQRMVVYDDLTIITADDGEGDVTVSLRRDGDSWKLARGPIAND